MTTFNLVKSYVGYTYEEIDTTTHKWSARRNLNQFGAGYTGDQLRDWLTKKRIELQARDDVRSLQPVWSPDGVHDVVVRTFDEALALHLSTWRNGAEPNDQWVVLEGTVVEGVTVHGPFHDGEAANDWARESDYQTATAPMQEPT